MHSSNVQLSVIVPVFNEASSITDFLGALSDSLSRLVTGFEIIVVDDGSQDGTWSILSSLRGNFPHLKALRLSRNFGKDAALSAGIQESQGHLCLIMDGDFEHPIELIPTMLETHRTTGANIVDAVKTRASSESWSSRLFAKTFYRLFGWVADFNLDGHTDFKLFDRQAQPERQVRLGRQGRQVPSEPRAQLERQVPPERQAQPEQQVLPERQVLPARQVEEYPPTFLPRIRHQQ